MKSTTMGLLCLILILAGCKEDDQKPENGVATAFEQLWSDFDEFYPYFELKGIDWDSVYSVNESLINEETTEHELKDILIQMTLGLRDLHVRFIASGQTHQYQKRHFYLSNSPDNVSNYVENIVIDNDRIFFADIKSTGIAYVRVKTLRGSPNDYVEFSNIFNSLPSKEALIIDLRDNGGGSDAVGRAFASRLTGEDRIYEWVRYRNGPGHNDFGDWISASISPENPVEFQKPLVVLTNRGCYSSTESFVLMLKSLPNATLVGDTTGGATGNPKEFALFNGWKYYISTWQSVSPDYQFIEDHGIAPDIVEINSGESINEGRDMILEKALDILQ